METRRRQKTRRWEPGEQKGRGLVIYRSNGVGGLDPQEWCEISDVPGDLVVSQGSMIYHDVSDT